MNSAASTFFANQFKPRLEDKFSKIQDPLSDNEITQFNSWAGLLVETDESLSKQTSSTRSRRRRARYFSRKTYSISAELFVLCSLSYHISTLPLIPPGPFYKQLEDWWKSCPPQPSLSSVTIAICCNLPRQETITQDTAALGVSERPPKRLQERSELIFPGNPASSDGDPYLSFSFMRRHMIDKLPEPFRTGMRMSKMGYADGFSISNVLGLGDPE
ncbi:hypothetical protein BJX68DRAFT_259167 [Aspergillus pseudodeflectus]|uniref:Uncharacterized protein n=1 Tax=Aspergillus pseudodeflectus TaxID=176178 RepID=A0ABR4JF78_9EURO